MVNKFYEKLLPHSPGYQIDTSRKEMKYNQTFTKLLVSSFPMLAILVTHLLAIWGYMSNTMDVPFYLGCCYGINSVMATSVLAMNYIGFTMGEDMFEFNFIQTMIYDWNLRDQGHFPETSDRSTKGLIAKGTFIQLPVF